MTIGRYRERAGVVRVRFVRVRTSYVGAERWDRDRPSGKRMATGVNEQCRLCDVNKILSCTFNYRTRRIAEKFKLLRNRNVTGRNVSRQCRKRRTNICTRLNRSELISSAIGRIRFFGVLPRRLSRPLGFYETDTHPVDSARNAVVEAHEFGVQHQTRLVDYRHRTRSIDVGRVPLRPTIDNRVKSVLETRGQWRNRRQKSSLVHRCCTDEPYK